MKPNEVQQTEKNPFLSFNFGKMIEFYFKILFHQIVSKSFNLIDKSEL